MHKHYGNVIMLPNVIMLVIVMLCYENVIMSSEITFSQIVM